MKNAKSYLKNQYHQAKKYFFAKQPQFVFLSGLLVISFYLKQTAYFINVINIQVMTLILWPITVITLNLKSKASFILAFAILFICPFLMVLDTSGWEPGRFADYTFVFLLTGIIQGIVGSFKK